ncbi:MAG TPA: hypothetical protein VLE45_12675 [Burkholderiaceae bacterium]|nr:hypothetical protein [Burkholderiaceae bacterium]
MQRAALLALTLATVLLTACAAMGTRYAEDPIGTAAVGAGQARLVVYRQANTLQYSVREARLELDGSAVGGLLPAGFRAFDVPAGPRRIVVDMWDAPGRCELTAELQGATTHYFEVAPRLESWLAGAPAVAAPPVPAGGLVGGVMMMGSMAIESAGKACGGAFSIVAVDAAVARPRLADLRDSR